MNTDEHRWFSERNDVVPVATPHIPPKPIRVHPWFQQKGAAKAAPNATPDDHSSGTMSSATMLMILMSGFTAGPAVSL
jgi:hypothetical protein